MAKARKTALLIKKCCPDLPMETRKHIEIVLVKHLLKLSTYSAYSKELSHILPTDMRKEIRNRALLDFDIVVSLKCALLEIFSVKNMPLTRKAAVLKQWELSAAYLKLVQELVNAKLTTRINAVARKCNLEFKRPKEVQNACGTVVMKFYSSMSKLVWVKLRFILKSNNMTDTQLVSELMEKAISTYYAEYPFKTGQHMINTVNRAFRNKALNMIKFYNAEKRRRLSEDGQGGFSATCIGINMSENENGGAENSHIYAGTSDGISLAQVSETAKIETGLNLESLRIKLADKPKKMQVINLMTFQHNQGFIDYLRNAYPKRVRQVYDMEDVYEKLGHEAYCEGIIGFLKIKPSSFYSFVGELKHLL